MLRSPFPATILLLPLFLAIARAGARQARPTDAFSSNAPGHRMAVRSNCSSQTMTDERAGLTAGRCQTSAPHELRALLRRTSPGQFARVMSTVPCAGDMSLVGPRPLPHGLPATLRAVASTPAMRRDPASRGWRSVSGRNLLSWDERFALDVCTGSTGRSFST